MRRRKRMKRRRHYAGTRVARKRKRISILVAVGVTAILAIVFLIPPVRTAIFSFSPKNAVADAWTSMVDPDRAAVLGSTASSVTAVATVSGDISNNLIVPTTSVAPATVSDVQAARVSLKPRYALDIVLDEKATTFTVSQQMFFTNTTENALPQVVLLMPATDGLIQTSSIIINEQNIVDYQQDEANHMAYIQLPTPIEAGQEARMSIVYNVTLPESQTVPGTNGRSRQIANFMPLLAPYDGTTWLSDEESKLGNVAEFLITLQTPKSVEFDLAVSGNPVAQAQAAAENMNVSQYELKGVSQFSMAVGSSMRKGNILAGETNLSFEMYHTGQVTGWEENAQAGFSYVQGLFGNFPYPVYVFEADIADLSAQAGNIVFINSEAADRRRTEASSILVPQLAKVWTARTAGQDPALASLLTRYCVQRYQNEEEFAAITMQAVSANEAGGLDALAAQSSEQQVVLDETAAGLVEGAEQATVASESGQISAIDEGVRALILMRAQYGPDIFDAALREYMQSGGENPFSNYFNEALRSEIDMVLQVAVKTTN